MRAASSPADRRRGRPAARPGSDPCPLDAAAFGREWARAAPSLRAWATHHVRAPLLPLLEPDDLLQEVACRAWRRRRTCDARRGGFRPWVFGIARHVLHEALRRRGVRVAAGADVACASAGAFVVPDASVALAQAENLRHFAMRFALLPPDERCLLVCCGLEGLTQGQAAARLHVSPDAAAKRWQRLCRRVRAEGRWAELASG